MSQSDMLISLPAMVPAYGAQQETLASDVSSDGERFVLGSYDGGNNSHGATAAKYGVDAGSAGTQCRFG